MDHARTTRPLIVTAPHVRTYPDPISVTTGEHVIAGDHDVQGDPPGRWIWCTNRTGKAGWVPEQFLHITEGAAVALVDCDTIELTVSAGTRLWGGSPVNGWIWCETDDDAGWVPVANVRDDESAP